MASSILQNHEGLKFSLIFLIIQITNIGMCSSSAIEPLRNQSFLDKPGYQNENNHVPVFLSCESYKPHIKEDQPTGTYVIRVKTFDPDPLEGGGTIMYQLVTDYLEQPKFHIDSQSGIITTRYIFDHDEPTREKKMNITVRATDNGSPELDAICAFIVIIDDINDNEPKFNKEIYRESISKHQKINTEVMRISAIDIDDGLNAVIEYTIIGGEGTDHSYFTVNKYTGSVILNKQIDKTPNYVFKIKASATDKSRTEPQSTSVHLEITVIESDKMAPVFVDDQSSLVILREDFNGRTAHVARIQARSNTDEPAPIFTLVSGKSEQTNSKDTFVLKTDGNRAYILLNGYLDYEVIKEYTLTVRIENKYNLTAERTITVRLEDVNDNAPKFYKEFSSGQVLENEDPGTVVMKVTAIDEDETPEFSKITYELQDFKDEFSIDPDTGLITTKVRFDREERNVYNVKVIAQDGAPSAILKNGQPNAGEQVFRIVIADKNDQKPSFHQKRVFAILPEDTDLNSLVIEVAAEDEDDASFISYSIVGGNVDYAFFIESTTGRIKTAKKLDYEKITSYKLKVEADDGLFRDDCIVEIEIININDKIPEFEHIQNHIKIEEERMLTDCIITVTAYDPDIGNRDEPQNIKYSLLRPEQQEYFRIDSNGCLTMRKPFDRDPPKGVQQYFVWIKASDEGGVLPSSKTNVASSMITVIDINDNAPTLEMSEPIVWQNHRKPGQITKLIASDKDGPGNGEPFHFKLADEASADIRKKFAVTASHLVALTIFNRHQQKEYQVPIAITDSGNPPCTGVSYLNVTITE